MVHTSLHVENAEFKLELGYLGFGEATVLLVLAEGLSSATFPSNHPEWRQVGIIVIVVVPLVSWKCCPLCKILGSINQT